MARLFFIAGETSGDLHGSLLIKALREMVPSVVCEGLGGPRMAASGMNLRYDLASQGIMGFTEVMRAFLLIRKVFYDTLAYLRETRPDAVVLIDYPGFNIRLAQRLKRYGIPVIYYISPQVWAWKKHRIKILAECVSKMLVIFPFEEKLYRDVEVDCVYVGHPLVDILSNFPICSESGSSYVITLMPGSREQEIRRIAPVMMNIAQGILEQYPSVQFLVPCVDENRKKQVEQLAKNLPITIEVGTSYEMLQRSRLCLVASGTATLEATYFEIPMIILYKVSEVSYWLARLLVDIPYIGMVNILAGDKIVPEFIQHQATASRVLPVALRLLENSPEREQMLDALRRVKQKLGGPGASKKAAEEILAAINQR